MRGLRLGWLVAPPALLPALRVVQKIFFMSPNGTFQCAGVANLRHAAPDVKSMVEQYAKRRTLLMERLRALGFGIRSQPVGAFYVLADARHLFPREQRPDSLGLALDILEKAHVGVAPGIDFGRRAEGYLRFSYANSLENIEEAMHRLENYLSNRMQ